MNFTETDAILILNAIDGLGPQRIRQLVEYFGSAGNVLSASESDLVVSKCIPTAVITNLLNFNAKQFLEQELKLMAQYQARFVTYHDIDFPSLLLQIPGCPIGLYLQGNLQQLPEIAVAIVGSRHASVYGITVANQFAAQLVEKGIAVVSGMARGIDTAAHYGAVNTKGVTVAVLGSGLAQIYPPENKSLSEKIREQGCLVSEFPMMTSPLPYHFPRRNRIISGLSLGVVVVEAAQKSGALITADLALEQGREVFAVPGKVDSPTANGTNHLIKQGARLVTCIDDVLEELVLPLKQRMTSDLLVENIAEQEFSNSNLTESQLIVYSLISSEPIDMDELSEKSKLPVAQLNVILFELELKKVIKQKPGKIFVKI